MHEAPKILAAFALPKRDSDDPDEALLFAVHPQTNELVVQVAVTPERLATYTYEAPPSFPVPRDATLQLAHEILRHWAPEVAAIVERECVREQLRLVSGGADEPEAS
jgi:hypothetical protein